MLGLEDCGEHCQGLAGALVVGAGEVCGIGHRVDLGRCNISGGGGCGRVNITNLQQGGDVGE